MISELSSKRLRLRPVNPGDAITRFMLLQDKELAHLLGTDPPTRKVMIGNIEKLIMKNKLEDSIAFHWALEDKKTGHTVGYFHVHAPAPSFMGWGFHAISYELFREHWGHGFMCEAMITAMNWMFLEQQGIYRLEAYIEPHNARSIRLVERLGFKHEGTCRGLGKWNREQHDMRLYALLQPDWLTERPALEFEEA